MLDEFFADEFRLSVCHDGNEALERMVSSRHDLLVLDVMLPGVDGLTVLQQVRVDSRLPIIMLTAMGGDRDRIAGLDLGADDYLAKPFNPEELRSRIKAVLRRTHCVESPASLQIQGLTLIPDSLQAFISDEPVAFTAAEIRMLELLMRSPGKPVPREQLSRCALGRSLSLHDRSVDTHISNLRRKLACHEDVPQIRSVRAAGYQLSPDVSAP